MADFDWMKDATFREDITQALLRAAQAGGMSKYQPEIIARLMAQLSQHRDGLVLEENVKVASLRRTKQDALASVETLIKRASEIAASDKRTLLEARDYDQAYQEKFCMVWPFCGKKK